MDHPINRPTYEEHIKQLFTVGDINCMRNRGVDLSGYEGVRREASRILEWVGSGRMPPPHMGRAWSPEQLQTFRNWTEKSGFAKSEMVRLNRSKEQRIRKSIHDINPDGEELKLLKKAFAGLMDRDGDLNDPRSFFNLAGIHWLPGPKTDCRHHDNAYNPWHRAYLAAFEDALRSVDGCETVTLPYWDILGAQLPSWVYEQPFYKYALPYELKQLDNQTIFRKKGEETVRDSAVEIAHNVTANKENIENQIIKALSAKSWDRFNGWSGGHFVHEAIIQAHDFGHSACGEKSTISFQETAAFDPLFWFFHCNWDRLWWKWQTELDATDIPTFRKAVEGEAKWLDDIPGNILSPFDVVAAEMIDLSTWNIEYEQPQSESIPESDKWVFARGSIGAHETFSVAATERYSVRIKNINRLNIPGSFYVFLYAGEEVLRRTFVFQPSTPQDCENCRKHGVFSTDFIIDKSELGAGKPLRLGIEVVNVEGEREAVPLSQCGDPTLNIRVLLDTI